MAPGFKGIILKFLRLLPLQSNVVPQGFKVVVLGALGCDPMGDMLVIVFIPG